MLDLHLPEEKRKLEESEIVTLSSEFLSGGTDTTATSLQWIMANLVKAPKIQAKLFHEIKHVIGKQKENVEEEDLDKIPYLKAVILEGLRRHPPGHFVLPHAVTEDITLVLGSIPMWPCLPQGERPPLSSGGFFSHVLWQLLRRFFFQPCLLDDFKEHLFLCFFSFFKCL